MTDLDSSDVVRVRLDFSYDGTEFRGWARQPDLRTVQGHLEEALARLVRRDVTIVVAGRTDAGVHARGQVAHADIPREVWDRLPGYSRRTPGHALARKLNGITDNDVVVASAQLAPDGFDARFSALQRRYVYRIADRATPRDPLMRRHVWWLDRNLDVERAAAVSQTVLGLRDFAAFCKRREGATTIRTLLEFDWTRVGAGDEQGMVQATVRADAFCHSMVRSLVGAAVQVATDLRDEQWFAEVAGASLRAESITVAPAHGLTLEDVSYPADDALASRADATRAMRSLD